MERLVLIVLSAFVYFNSAWGQMDNPDSLALHGIYAYPSDADLQKLVLNASAFTVSELSVDDINGEFSNISDLQWLKPIAIENKVLLIGETHYSNYINNLRNRIILAVNQYDYFPLLILENRYSLTPFVNHFLSISSESEAKEFFSEQLSEFVITVEDSLLFDHIRRWNIQHIDKPIGVGFTDMEWNNKTTKEKILKPYFQRLDIDQGQIDSIFDLGFTQAFIDGAEFLFRKAQAEQIRGEYAYITPRYIENVITNLKYTLYCYNINFDYYRQKGIIHNLTDEAVFGKKLESSKAIIYGGGYHTPTHQEFPFGGNFFTEGSYLTFDFAPTKGKTYSVMLEGLAFTLGKMADADASGVFAGRQYKNILERMQRAYSDGFLNPDKPYFAFGSRNSFTDIISHIAYQENASALLIDDIQWDVLYQTDVEDETLQMIEKIREESMRYDRYIYIPHSPLNILRVEKQP